MKRPCASSRPGIACAGTFRSMASELAMTTLGIDLSSNDQKTAACLIAWEAGRARVTDLERGLTNADLRERIRAADWTGIDAPFSWPVRFREQLADHHERGGWDKRYRDPDFQFRATDVFVEGCARRPLSVSTNLIGVTAMRCARLLEEVGADRGQRLDLTGKNQVVEVYPGAALAAWGAKDAGFDPDGYKTGSAAKEKRRVLAQAIFGAAGWLEAADDVKERCVRWDDELDALIAALTTRAAARGLSRPPETEAQRRLAPVEGWIHVPQPGSFERLPG